VGFLHHRSIRSLQGWRLKDGVGRERMMGRRSRLAAAVLLDWVARVMVPGGAVSCCP
jgi:hypothetical protein